MRNSLTRYTFTLVAIGSLGASAFRVSTAPDRIRERNETARQVCMARGGAWQALQHGGQCNTLVATSKT